MARSIRGLAALLVSLCLLWGCGGGGGGATPPALTLSPSSLTANQQAGTSSTLTVRATASDPSVFNSTVYVVIVDSQGVLTDSLDLTEIDARTFAATIHTQPNLSIGRHQGTLQIHLCRDAQCASEFPGSPVPLPYDFTVTPGPLKATPGSGLTLLASTTEGALNALDVTVQGVFSTGIPDVDKRLVYLDVATAQKLLVTPRVSSLGVFLSHMEATDPARQRIAAALPQLAVQTWLDQAVFYKSVKELYNRIFGALGLVIGVIVVFVVTNAMAMAIIERTREIGTLRALGTLPGQLIRSLALEGLVLGGAGALLGSLIALAVSMMLLWFPVQMPPPPGRSTGYPLQVVIDGGLYGATLLAMVLLSMAASAWVARRTVRKPIVDALAHV